MKPTWAALIGTLGVTLLLIVPALVVLVYTARETLDAVGTMQKALSVQGQGPDQGLVLQAEEWVRTRLPAPGKPSIFPIRCGRPRKAASFLGAKICRPAENLVSFSVDLVLLIFALFFMFRDGHDIVRGLRHLIAVDEEIQEDVLAESKN